jgi:perosamine synthetase
LFSAPQPRSRLYTTAAGYAKGAFAALTGYGYDGDGAAKFEARLEEMFPGFEAVAMPMARVGIYLTLKHLIRGGQKVLLSPYTISDVVNMVLCAGGIPLFCDVEEGGSCNIDADKAVEMIASHADIGAVLVTHFYGLICDIEPVLHACAKRGIPVIEDAAQAFGARLGERLAGSMGHAGVFSFGLLKNITGFFGGAVVTRDAALAAKLRREIAGYSVFSKKMLLKKMLAGASFDTATFPPVFDTAVYWLFRYAYLHDLSFFNNKLDTDRDPIAYRSFPAKYAHRLSSVQAEIILPQFSRIDADSAARIANARRYHEGLKDLPRVTLPPQRSDGSHIYLYYSILCEDRDALARFMTRHLRDVQISHHRNCASLPCFAEYRADCPNAEKAAQSVLYLPAYPTYGADQVSANIEVIRRYYREGNRWA